jgi:lipoate synthase
VWNIHNADFLITEIALLRMQKEVNIFLFCDLYRHVSRTTAELRESSGWTLLAVQTMELSKVCLTGRQRRDKCSQGAGALVAKLAALQASVPGAVTGKTGRRITV